MLLKQLATDIGNDFYDHAESVAAFSTCFIAVTTINWQGEIIRFTFGIGASIISAYVVNRLKKYWDDPTKLKKKK
jgi:hypothetical protein